MDKHLAKLIEKVKNPYLAVGIAAGVVLLLALISQAQAQPGQDPDFIPPGHRGGPGGNSEQLQGQAQQQGQLQGQAQGQISTNVNKNSSESTSRADADANAYSNSGGNRLSADGGRSEASSNSAGGAADASGGSSSVNYSNDYGSASAASVWMGYCQSGGSGQSENGGFSVVNSDQFCDHVRAAEAMLAAYEREAASCKCVGVCTEVEASVTLQCADSDQAQFYLAAYHENLKDANALVQDTQVTGFIGRVAGQLAIPTALLAALLFL